MNDAMPTPIDVKLMNVTATLLYAAFAIGMVLAAGWWAARNQMFSIRAIEVRGELAHNNAVTLRANVTSRLDGNFFTVDLAKARGAFEAAPWVRRAVVRRDFPSGLHVLLQEHHPTAFWGAEGESTMVNSFGEVFEANVDDVTDQLPRLSGPDGQSGGVLAMYQTLDPEFAPLDVSIDTLHMSARGGWSLTLDSGAEIELGAGTTDEVIARTRRFVHTLTQVTSKYGRRAESIESADLRYADGYAIRLRGVTTTEAVKKKVVSEDQ